MRSDIHCCRSICCMICFTLIASFQKTPAPYLLTARAMHRDCYGQRRHEKISLRNMSLSDILRDKQSKGDLIPYISKKVASRLSVQAGRGFIWPNQSLRAVMPRYKISVCSRFISCTTRTATPLTAAFVNRTNSFGGRHGVSHSQRSMETTTASVKKLMRKSRRLPSQ